jgi:hypothetical protein
VSAHEDLAGAFGDELARLVDEGKLTHAEVMAWFAGDKAADDKLMRVLTDEWKQTQKPVSPEREPSNG